MDFREFSALYDNPTGNGPIARLSRLDIKGLRSLLGISQAKMSKLYGIPRRTIEDWESGVRTPPNYLVKLLAYSALEDIHKERRSNMRIHQAVKGNTKIRFSQEEAAQQFITENPGYEYEQSREWWYFDSNASNRKVYISGPNLVVAIENNIVPILKCMGLYGPSGYTLKSARLYRKDDKVFFEVEGWTFSEALVGFGEEPDKTPTDDNAVQLRLEINNVSDDELEEEYIFELVDRRAE